MQYACYAPVLVVPARKSPTSPVGVVPCPLARMSDDNHSLMLLRRTALTDRPPLRR